MNKKGLLFYWIALGILAAIGLVFVMTAKPEVAEPKGLWQLSLLGAVEEGEEKLLLVDGAAKFAGWQAALELGEKGGFVSESGCGAWEGYQFWNKKNGEEEFCFPEVEGEIRERFNHYFKKYYTWEYKEVGFDREELWGKTDKRGEVFYSVKHIPTEKKKASLFTSYEAFLIKPFYFDYNYSLNFRVGLGYSFDDYEKLEEEAQELLVCSNVKELESCVKEKKEKRWKFKDCVQEEYVSEGRKIGFCVESGVSVYDAEGKLKPVRYKLALDFTPTTLWSVEGAEVNYDMVNGGYEVKFEAEEGVEGYKIYFTDYTALEGKGGKAEQLEGRVAGKGMEGGFFWGEVEIKVDSVILEPDKCTSGGEKEVNKGYLCGERILFVLKDERLSEGGGEDGGKKYLFGVTAIKGEEESEVKELVEGG